MSDSVVWGEGPPDARVIILGQNPGPEEMTAGRPFVGGSGRVLDRALQRVGLARSRCYITNVVKHFVPPGHFVPPLLVQQDKWMLDQELANLPKAEIVVTLGKEAFDAFTGKDLKTRHNRKAAEKNPSYWLRGCPYKLGNYWVLPAVHPSFVMRSGFMESPLFEVDLDRARRFNEGARPPSEHFNYNATDAEVREYVKETIAMGECGLDIETPEQAVDDDELDPLYETPIELVGLSCRIGEAVGVRPDQFIHLQPLLDGDANTPQGGVVCWGHNSGNFDFHHLSKKFSLKGIKRADTMLGMHLLWPHLTNKDLATCWSIFCDIPYYKNTRKLQPDYYNTVGNCRDTYGALWAGRNILRDMSKYKGMTELFWNHMMPACEWVNQVRVVGVNTDQDLAGRQLLILLKTLQQYEAWWNTNIPHCSWSSPKQLVELFRAMGMPIFKRKRAKKNADSGISTLTYTETCDDEALEEYVKRGNKTAGLIQTMRVLKHAGDYLQIAKSDDRIHTRLKLCGQVGGRVQAVDGNVQTIPEEISGTTPRSTIVADRPDRQCVITADFSQIEYRLYVTQAGDKTGIEQINSGEYLYGFFYEDIWKERFFQPGKPRTKSYIDSSVPPWKLLIAKSWPLGFIYGRGVPDPTGLPISKKDCQRIYENFHREHPAIGAFHTKLLYDAARNGYLLTPFGRLRRFPNTSGNNKNEILAFPGQTVAVDVLYRNVIIPFPTMLSRYNGRLMFTVHDSSISCVDVNHAKEALEQIQFTMQSPLRELNDLVIPAEVKIGPSWGGAIKPESYFAHAHSSAIAGHVPSTITG